MGCEESWTARLEVAEERRRGLDTEVKSVSNLDGSTDCEYLGECENKAVKRYEIGDVCELEGITIDLCKEHDEFEIAAMEYGRRV